MPHDDHYSLTELADLAGVTPRTVRYYLAQGLLPAVGQSGPGSKYGEGHLARLRLIRRLQAEHLPLAEIRRRLSHLSDADIEELAVTDPPAPPSDSALDYLRSVLAGPISAPPPVTPVRPVAPAAASTPNLAPPPLMSRLSRPMLSESAPMFEPSAPAPASDAEPPTTTMLERSQWERIALGADVELHIRRPLTRTQQKGIDRLVTIARELLEEERS